MFEQLSFIWVIMPPLVTWYRIMYSMDKKETMINYWSILTTSNLMTNVNTSRNSEHNITTPSIWMYQRHTVNTTQYFQSKASPVSFSPTCTLWQSWQRFATTKMFPESPLWKYTFLLSPTQVYDSGVLHPTYTSKLRRQTQYQELPLVQKEQ